MTDPTPLASASLRWTVPPPPRLATKVRELVTTIYRDLLSQDENDRIAIAAHELLENLLKYSSDGVSTFDVEICRRTSDAVVRLQTRNRASDEHLVVVRRTVDGIVQGGDPDRVYDELLATSPYRAGSGLGLARIRAEAGMDLACTTDGAVVTLTAERVVADGAP